MALKRDIQPNRHQQRHIDSLAQVRRLQRDRLQETAGPPAGAPSPCCTEAAGAPPPATAPGGGPRPTAGTAEAEQARAQEPAAPKLSPLAQLLRASPNLPAAMRARWQALVRAQAPPPADAGPPGPPLPPADAPAATLDLVALFAAAADTALTTKRKRQKAHTARRRTPALPEQLVLLELPSRAPASSLPGEADVPAR
ncbi:MAG: hypothetical protein KME03_19440 [Aphanocapsa lilacina HA4352-LM1]|jgi:hypothetical protein|nr:hypothetical protein [Aphanocapsa lilacina HA4352-LM1]